MLRAFLFACCSFDKNRQFEKEVEKERKKERGTQYVIFNMLEIKEMCLLFYCTLLSTFKLIFKTHILFIGLA